MAWSHGVVGAMGAVCLASCGPPAAVREDAPRSDAGPGIPVAVALSAVGGERMHELEGVELVALDAIDPTLPRFVVDDGIEHQTIVGFGSSFLEAGLVVLDTLPTREAEDAVLRALFDPDDGAGFSAMKTVIGGTDFQSAHPEWFTYADEPEDVDLSSFSVARDFEPLGVGTFIRRARENGGEFVLQATMDFPPDWMLVDPDTNQTVDPAHYDVLAEYFVRYAQAYEAEGIAVDYLSPFNEPLHYTDITMAEIHTLLRDHVAPALASSGVAMRLMLGETPGREGGADGYPPLLDDPALGPSIAAMAVHGYDFVNFDRMRELHERYPDVPLWQTEICCMPLVPEFDFDDGAFYGEQLLRDVEAGASAWLYWNTILHEHGGPWAISPRHGNNDGNFQPALVTIDSVTHEVRYTGPFYYLAHFSRFVRPGAVRLETTPTLADDVRAISFRAPDGELVVVAMNAAATPRRVVVEHDGRGATLELPAISVATARWRP